LWNTYDLKPSIAACESVYTLIILFSGHTHNAVKIAKISARVEEGKFFIQALKSIEEGILESRIKVQPKLILILSVPKLVKDPSVYT
jgi:hypothetical protein